jgi:TonB C terminal
MKQSPPVPPAYLPQPPRLAIPLLGALTSLLLHALLLTPALLGAATHTRHVPNSEASSMSVGSSEESTMMLVSIEQSGSDAKSARESNDVASPSPSPNALLPVAMPDFALLAALAQSNDEENQEAPANEARTSDSGHALLFGRYVGQIDARIQRAWIRPRTSIDSVMFVCRVRITQDPKGRVQEMELVRCNGDIAWQTSLVRAIQSASPLPAPPDPKVFSHILTLDFSSLPFSPGASSEGFEPESRTAMK